MDFLRVVQTARSVRQNHVNAQGIFEYVWNEPKSRNVSSAWTLARVSKNTNNELRRVYFRDYEQYSESRNNYR